MGGDAVSGMIITEFRKQDEARLQQMLYHHLFVATFHRMFRKNAQRPWFIGIIIGVTLIAYVISGHWILSAILGLVLTPTTLYVIARTLIERKKRNRFGDIAGDEPGYMYRFWTTPGHGIRVFYEAIVEDCAIGSIALFEHPSGDVEIQRVVTHPDYQGRGVAKALMGHAMKECRVRGVSKVILATSEVQVEAMRIYERFGFVEYEQEDFLMYKMHKYHIYL